MMRDAETLIRLRGGWIECPGEPYVLARHWPPRFDVESRTLFPPLRRRRLAQQVRQDLWRLLKGLRGFSPVIQIDAEQCGGLMTLTAGGRVLGTVPATVRDAMDSLLADGATRARWIACAQPHAGQS